MTLTTSDQDPQNIPKDIAQWMLTFLSLEDLSTTSQLSIEWSLLVGEELKKLAKKSEHRRRLQIELISAVNAKKFKPVQHLIQLGAHPNFRINGGVDKVFPWIMPARGDFRNPTLLCAAANSLSGNEGAKIIYLLLIKGADLSVKSEYKDFFAGEHGVHESKGHSIPVDDANDITIKTILYLAEFEIALVKSPIIDGDVLIKLKQASQYDSELTREYLDELVKPQLLFNGIQGEVETRHLDRVRDLPEFKEIHRNSGSSNLLKQHGVWLCGFFALITYSLLFLLLDATVIPIIGFCFAALLLGIKIREQCFYPSGKTHFPIQLEQPTPAFRASTCKGIFFPRLQMVQAKINEKPGILLQRPR